LIAAVFFVIGALIVVLSLVADLFHYSLEPRARPGVAT
jgi:ABC-type dipeptide/oligopeptide/nickel transport system permease component